MEEIKNTTQTAVGNPMSRKKFLRVCASIVAGGAVATMSGVLMKKMITAPDAAAISSSNMHPLVGEGAYISPYRLVSSFTTSEHIDGLELHQEKLYVAAGNEIFVFDHYGKLFHRFSTEKTIRDIAVNDAGIFLLHPAKIAVYAHQGTLLREWAACSDNSDYCSFALTPDFIFATDAANKNICKYTTAGNFVKFINSPNGFVIPSYTFGIEYIDGILYCSNSGRHQVESFTLDGKYITSFGKPGGAPGLFTGCCNPVHLTYTSNGDIITSEKGNPRISCYGSDGKFRSILLDSKSLGGGNTAYDVKLQEDKIFVAGKNKISVFRYDKSSASQTGCSNCGVTCPLRI